MPGAQHGAHFRRWLCADGGTVSLAAVTETPLVIVIGQRPGPATGLATRTEQGDLWFVLHAGQGNFRERCLPRRH